MNNQKSIVVLMVQFLKPKILKQHKTDLEQYPLAPTSTANRLTLQPLFSITLFKLIRKILIREILGFLGGNRALKSLPARVIGMSFGLVGGWGELQLAGVGKLNGWVLELNFAGQIINFKSLLIYLFFY